MTTSNSITQAHVPSRLLHSAFEPKVELQPVAGLSALGREARTHSDKQIGLIAESIRQLGFLNPLLIDDNGHVIAGMGRLRAARMLGLPDVPCVRVSHLSEAEKRAYVITENRSAELAGWDRTILALELKDLAELEPVFDLDLVGFNSIEREVMVLGLCEDDEEEVPPPPVAPVSRRGDLFQLGCHRLLCDDALSQASYDALMAREKARVVNTDPPFNVPMEGHITSKAHREFPMGNGEMDDPTFTGFLKTWLGLASGSLVDGGLAYVAMDWRHAWHLLGATRELPIEQVNLCIWNKMRGGQGSFYRSQHELVFVFKSGTAPHLNRVQLGKHGRDRTNVWDYEGSIGTSRKGAEEKVPHPTPKPVSMIGDLLQDCTEAGDIVLDPFGGGGSTLLAAERTGRRARVMDLDPGYVDLMVHRWERYTGRKAVLVSTGQTFQALSEERDRSEAPAPDTPLSALVRVRTRTGAPVRERVRTRAAVIDAATAVASAPCIRIRTRSNLASRG